MAKAKIDDLLNMFEDRNGFGDPDARRNAEQKIQWLLLQEQQNTANKQLKAAKNLNIATIILVFAAIVQAGASVFQSLPEIRETLSVIPKCGNESR